MWLQSQSTIILNLKHFLFTKTRHLNNEWVVLLSNEIGWTEMRLKFYKQFRLYGAINFTLLFLLLRRTLISGKINMKNSVKLNSKYFHLQQYDSSNRVCKN